MRILKKIGKAIFWLLTISIGYTLLSILISCIPINTNTEITNADKTIYLKSNGVHLSIVFPVDELSEDLKKDIKITDKIKFVAFGWGNENFYLKVPTWDKFKIQYAFEAFFGGGPTLIDVLFYENIQKNWVAIPINNDMAKKLSDYINNSFKKDVKGSKIYIEQNLYADTQVLYRANGSYSPVKTCNTWVNSAFKEGGLKASIWTLFDFGLLNKYE